MDWQLSSAEWSAVRLSLLVAVVATIVSLPFAVGMGYWMARRTFPGKTLVETLISLPLVLPPVVTGYLLLIAFGQRGWLGKRLLDWFGLTIVFTWKGAALASAVMAFPLMVRAIRIAIADVDHRLELAARTLGAGPLETFWRITLPLARRGVVAGAVLGFARSLGEFGATIMIAGNIPGETQTVPLFIYTLMNSPGGMEAGARLAAISVVLDGSALLVSEWLERGVRTKRSQPG